jgi:hypothetical protein
MMFALLFVACPMDNCDSMAGPDPEPPPVTTTTTIEEPDIPPRVDQEFTWDGASGFSLFAGLRLDEQEIRTIFVQAHNARRNTARVCAETEFWPDNENYPAVPRSVETLRFFLDTVARIPGAQVLLINNCTLKHSSNFKMQEEWNIKASQVAGEFKNVAIEVVNEPQRHLDYFHDKEHLVRQLIRDARRHSGGLQVGADDSFHRSSTNLRHYLLSSVDFASFHPARTSNNQPWDPNRAYLRNVKEANPGKQIVLSETVGWDDNGDQCTNWLRTCERERIIYYERRCEREGIIFFFHSEDGLAARVPFSWMGR